MCRQSAKKYRNIIAFHAAAANAINVSINVNNEDLGEQVWDWIDAADSSVQDANVYRQRVRFLLHFERESEIADLILSASTVGCVRM